MDLNLLIQKLEEAFDTSYDRNTTLEELRVKAGYAEVIEYIKSLKEEVLDVHV
jgi:hypothetical protein